MSKLTSEPMCSWPNSTESNVSSGPTQLQERLTEHHRQVLVISDSCGRLVKLTFASILFVDDLAATRLRCSMIA